MNDLTIVIPLYNHENELVRCLNSLLKVIDEKMNILVVDDGSTDKGYIVAKEYSKKNKLVKVIHKENGGVCSARNFGIEHSNSRYITFCDPDDTINSAYNYRKLIDIMKNNKYDYLAFNFSYYKENKIILNNEFPKQNIVVENAKDLEYLRASAFVGSINNLGIDYYNGGAYVWNKIYDLSIIKNNNIFFDTNLNFSEDAIYNFIYLSHINRGILINEPMYNYNVYAENTTNSYKRAIAENYDIFYKKLKNIDNNSPIIKNACYARILRNLTNILRYNTFHKCNNEKYSIKCLLNKYPYYQEAIKKVKYKYLSKKQKVLAFFLKCRIYKIVEIMFKI